MLLTRISQPPPLSPTPEDIFSSALTTIFTDDTVNSHGTPGSYVTYRSPRFGDLKLSIPAHPDEEDGRKLFAHYLWNAAVLAADAIETASRDADVVKDHDAENVRKQERKVIWDQRFWDLRGKSTLELGAGTALPSLIAALSGARSCIITDHPSSPALTTGAIEKNVKFNLFYPGCGSTNISNENVSGSQGTESAAAALSKRRDIGNVQILGYTWGTSTFYIPNKYGKPAPPNWTPRHFDRIILADCLWMPSQHINLIKTILQFLPSKKSDTSGTESSDDAGGAQTGLNANASTGTQRTSEVSPREEVGADVPCTLVVAGFHTGRKIVSDFFTLATESHPSLDESERPSTSSALHSNQTPDPSKENTISIDPSTLTPSERSVCGLLQLASIFEVDVDGDTRPWLDERQAEGKWDAKRWCAVGVLVRR